MFAEKRKKLFIFVHMARTLSYILLLFITVTILASCAAPRYGCPMNTSRTGKFRG